MKDEKNKPEDGEVTEQQLEEVAGGAAPASNVKITSVEGESTDDKHKDWIEILPDD